MKDAETIVILTPAFPASESETYWVPSQQLMVKALRKKFPEINIVVLSFLYPYRKSEYSWYGTEVISFDGMHRRKLNRVSLFRDIWQTLKRTTKEHNVIGLLSFWCGECALIGKWFGKWNHVKHYSWICGQDARKANNLVKLIRPAGDELAAMSPFLADEFQRNHGVRPKHLVENAIDPELFPHLTDGRTLDILGVGSFEPLKQYDVFIEIVRSIHHQMPGIKVFHCGIGREKEKIESLIKKYELEENFRLLGGKSHEEVLSLMQQTKIFLHTSNYEGFSTVCLEALYAGCHVVSFVKPIREDIKHWHLVKTPEEMVRKCLLLLQNTQLDFGRVLIHSMDESAKKMMNLFAKRVNNESS